MKFRNVKTLFAILAVMTTILACGAPGAEKATEIPATQEQATEAPALEGAGGMANDPASLPVTGNDSASESVQHSVIPASLPTDRSSHAGDYDSSLTAKNKIAAGGDRFTFGRFERPFNANTMDVYFPNLDIVDTFVYQDETWIYGTITLAGLDANNSLTGKYAIELDTDRDGKGDWLIIATNPSAEWSTLGVQVFEDANNDVGNITAMFADEKAAGDGFEKIIFDQGNGEDADAAWARISPSDPKTVEISVKRSVVGNPDQYLINMWAGNSLLDPALFDINDHFTHEQAGAADPGLELYYPIKGVSEIDNSCRMAVGFEPTGKEPGLCEIFIPQSVEAPAPTPVPACKAPPYCTGRSYYWNEKTCTCETVLY